jgi:hypothetical protein
MVPVYWPDAKDGLMAAVSVADPVPDAGVTVSHGWSETATQLAPWVTRLKVETDPGPAIPAVVSGNSFDGDRRWSTV